MIGLSLSEAARIVERAEGDAWADMLGGTPAAYVAANGIRTWRVGEAVGFAVDGTENPYFHRFHGLGALAPATTSSLRQATAPWSGSGQTFVMHAVPDEVAPGLSGLLESGGLRPSRSWVKMLRGTEPPPDVRTDLRIEEIGQERADAFAAVAAAAFELPEYGEPFRSLVGRAGWRAYAGFDGALPVAVGALRIADDVAWLGGGATLESHRGRGAQGAILARRMADAIALGCRWLTTETGEELPGEPNHSYRNMLRVGFTLVYPRRNWLGIAAD